MSHEAVKLVRQPVPAESGPGGLPEGQSVPNLGHKDIAPFPGPVGSVERDTKPVAFISALPAGNVSPDSLPTSPSNAALQDGSTLTSDAQIQVKTSPLPMREEVHAGGQDAVSRQVQKPSDDTDSEPQTTALSQENPRAVSFFRLDEALYFVKLFGEDAPHDCVEIVEGVKEGTIIVSPVEERVSAQDERFDDVRRVMVQSQGQGVMSPRWFLEGLQRLGGVVTRDTSDQEETLRQGSHSVTDGEGVDGSFAQRATVHVDGETVRKTTGGVSMEGTVGSHEVGYDDSITYEEREGIVHIKGGMESEANLPAYGIETRGNVTADLRVSVRRFTTERHFTITGGESQHPQFPNGLDSGDDTITIVAQNPSHGQGSVQVSEEAAAGDVEVDGYIATGFSDGEITVEKPDGSSVVRVESGRVWDRPHVTADGDEVSGRTNQSLFRFPLAHVLYRFTGLPYED